MQIILEFLCDANFVSQWLQAQKSLHQDDHTCMFGFKQNWIFIFSLGVNPEVHDSDLEINLSSGKRQKSWLKSQEMIQYVS